MGCKVIITSTGASSDVWTSLPPDPRWMDTTTSSSLHARQNGSHPPPWKVGYPSPAGLSVNVTEWHPMAASRRTSSAASSGSHNTGSAMGMNRPG
jgi:hypothetical protein